MNLISRTITGILMFILGLILIGVSFFISFIFLIYGVIVLVLGIIIFFNKREDKIEGIKLKKNERRKSK